MPQWSRMLTQRGNVFWRSLMWSSESDLLTWHSLLVRDPFIGPPWEFVIAADFILFVFRFLTLPEVGKPKPRLALKRKSDGASLVLVELSNTWILFLWIGMNPGMRGPRLAGTASYSGKSSSKFPGGLFGGRGGRPFKKSENVCSFKISLINTWDWL